MPDPAKTPEEIEDVLASIRRLVSDNSSAPVTASKEPPAAASAAAPDDRLVLTSSFRVSDPEDPWVPVGAAHPIAPKRSLLTNAGTAKRNDTGWLPDDRLANFDDVGDTGGDTLDGPDQPPEQSEADTEDLLRLDGAVEESAEFEPETGDDNWPTPGAELALLTLVARREPSDGSTAPEPADADDDLGEVAGATPSHDTPVADNMGSEGSTDTDVPEADLAGDMAVSDDASDDTLSDTPDDTPDGADDQARAEALVADAVMEDATPQDAVPEDDAVDPADDIADDHGDDTGNSSDDEDPMQTDQTPDDGSGHLDENHDLNIAANHIAEDETPQDKPTPVPVFSARAPVEDTGPEAPVDDLGDDPTPFSIPEAEDGFMDEETLREIIVEVVREELQGVLGQRITRNVRKMVRREVRLALAAEDLE